MTVEALQKIDRMKLKDGVDTKRLREKVLTDFTKLMAIGLAQKVLDKQLADVKRKKEADMRKQYESRS